jgi:hypothetical protein
MRDDGVVRRALDEIFKLGNTTLLTQETNQRLCAQRTPFGLQDTATHLAQLLSLDNNKADRTQKGRDSSIKDVCIHLAGLLRQSGANGLPQLPLATSSCAVVGSGGGLAHHQYGAYIDKHDYIIRFNAAPPLLARVVGTSNGRFRQHVGSRTSLRIATHAPWRHHRRDGHPPERLLLYCHNSWHGVCQRDILARFGAGGAPVHAANPVLVGKITKLVDSIAKRPLHRSPSTGMLGVGIALALCGVINLFGFGNVSAFADALCDHYWECRVPTSSYYFDRTQRLSHDWESQWHMLLWLANKGRVTLHATEGGTHFRGSTLPPRSSTRAARRKALSRRGTSRSADK